MCFNPPNHMNYTNISYQPAMLHFPCVKRAYVIHPPVCPQTGEVHCFGSQCGETIIICHPTLKSSYPKWQPSEWMPNEDKSSFWEQPPVWKELRPCVSEFVKEAVRWRRDDTGLQAEEQRVVVRRMNSDWRSAQWQLNDLRSVDSVSINQTALSCSPIFFSSISLWL